MAEILVCALCDLEEPMPEMPKDMRLYLMGLHLNVAHGLPNIINAPYDPEMKRWAMSDGKVLIKIKEAE